MTDHKQDRAWELLDAIGEANEGFIADAGQPQKRKPHRQNFWKYGSIAACLVLALTLPLLALLPFGGNGTVSGSESGNSMVLEGSTGESNPVSKDGESTDPDTSGEVVRPPLGPVVAASGKDLMAGITPAKVGRQDADEDFLRSQMRFSLALFQQAAKGEKAGGNSLLLSPLSAQLALSMTANGADGQTREEMVSLLAGDLSLTQLNSYLHTLAERLTEAGDGYKVNLANSIWYNEWVQVYEAFLQTNADYYGAGAMRMPFDEKAKDAINAWASEKTDGMIREALTEIDPEAAVYLLNAILFDAEWGSVYFERDVTKSTFSAYSGEERQISLMHSDEDTYYEDDLATGFAKPYKGGKYAFVALLPNEGVDVYDYVASLTAEGLLHTLQNGKKERVDAALPKFSFSYDSKLAEMLAAMGMESAFTPGEADFSRMMTADGYLKSVNQKTVISVGELGTKAAAVTVAVAPPELEPEHSVRLDRPFVYMIVDAQTNLPLFMGVQTDIDDSGVPEGEAPEIGGGFLPPEPEPEPEPPSYEGKDFTGLTVRLQGAYVTPDTTLLQVLLENGSETTYEYMDSDVLLQKKTEAGWETLPRCHESHLLYQVPAGETGRDSINLQMIYEIELAAGETYRVVFPGVEGLFCEFTVIGRGSDTPDASELRLQLDDRLYDGIKFVIFQLTNNSDLTFVYNNSDILLERKTADGWETFTLLEPEEWEIVRLPGEVAILGIYPGDYGVEFRSGETYRIAFRNVPGLYEEFIIP